MKWYWILLIVLAAIALGLVIANAVKKKPAASSPATNTDALAGKPKVDVTTNGKDTVITETKANGEKKIAIVGN